MSAPFPVSGRYLRAALLLAGGWLVLEYAVLSLLAERIGWGGVLTLLSVKGGFGLLVVGLVAGRGLAALGRGPLRRPGLDMAFQVASGVLITLPGLVPTLFGIALFAPSLRASVLKRLNRPAQTAASPREIELSGQEWREIRTRRIARKAKPRGESASADALEAKPPSV